MNSPPAKPKKLELPNQIDYKTYKEKRSKRLKYANDVSDFKDQFPDKENLENTVTLVSSNNRKFFEKIEFD